MSTTGRVASEDHSNGSHIFAGSGSPEPHPPHPMFMSNQPAFAMENEKNNTEKMITFLKFEKTIIFTRKLRTEAKRIGNTESEERKVLIRRLKLFQISPT